MLFNSQTFLLLYFPLVALGYWLIKSHSLRLVWLLGANYLFYAWANWQLVPLLITITLINYGAGRQIERKQHPQAWLTLAILVNLGVLSLFKYYDLGATQINTWVGDAFLPILQVALPVGISFYIFQSLTYPLDLFYERTQTAPNLLTFGAFVSFFPSLLAGPILRWTDSREAFVKFPNSLRQEHIFLGVKFFTLGLAQKVLIADPIASGLVNPLFKDYAAHGFFLSWLTALAYGAQLYFDFAGYSDMAIGVGHFLGFDLPRNFARPYQAANIGEFWNRWHISLSTWFRDYLFYPFSRKALKQTNRRSPRLVRATAHLLTMIVIGAWHGGTLNFIAWGIFHGVLLIIYHETRSWGLIRWRWVSAILTIASVSFSWIIFRTGNLSQTLAIWQQMLGLNGFESLSEILGAVPELPLAISLVAIFILLILPDAYSWNPPQKPWVGFIFGILFALAVGMLVRPAPFLYFAF